MGYRDMVLSYEIGRNVVLQGLLEAVKGLMIT
jgi:hypothetical protein